MDQINHIGRPCDSELRFCGTAQRFWTQRSSARLAGWLAEACNRSSRFPWAHQADGDGKDGGDKPAVNPKPPSIQRQVMSEIRVWETWRRMEWMVWMVGGLVSARSGLDHTQLGRAGLAWGWIYEAWCRIVVWGYGGEGGPRQWCSMVTCLRSAWHRFCRNVCVCVPRGCASSVFGGIQRWARASLMLRHSRGRVGGKYDLHCHKGERMLSFHNIQKGNLNMCTKTVHHIQFYLKEILYLNSRAAHIFQNIYLLEETFFLCYHI